jgi:thiol-disulfide isomerase/thioredoxin
MLRLIILTFCLFAGACTPPQAPVSNNLDTQKDLSPADVEDDSFLSTLEGIHDIDPLTLLPPSLITWDTCSGVEGDHPCNLIGNDQFRNTFGLYVNIGRPIVLDFSTGWCGPCRAAAGHAQEVQDNYSSDELLYITVLIENSSGGTPTQADISDWAIEYGLNTSLVIGSSRGILESSGGPWPLSGWPTFYYIDRNMVLRDIDRGYNESEVIYSIEWLLTL